MKINKVVFFVVILISTLMYSCNSGGNKQVHQPGEKNAPVTEGEPEKINGMGNFNEIINSNTPVLVDFYADWCAPCKVMAPVLQQVSRDMEGKIRVIKIDVDKNEAVARKYQIRSIPTMILFKNGQIAWQGVGVMQAEQIKAVIEKNS